MDILKDAFPPRSRWMRSAYLKEYPDVQEGIRRGEFESAQTHFVSNGYREGRRPFP